MEDTNNKDYLEELKKDLYSKRNVFSQRKKISNLISRKNFSIPEDWGSNAREKISAVKKSFLYERGIFKKFLLGSIIFFLISITFTFFVFYRGQNTVSLDNIEINIMGDTFVAGGEELPLQIEVSNKNNTPLEFGELLIEYPRGSTGSVENDFVRLRESLGTIPSGGTVRKDIKVILFGKQGELKEIKTTLEYRVKNSNAIFSKEQKYSVSLSSSPLVLSVLAPSKISSNQQIEIEARMISNSKEILKDVLLKVDYPPGFKFEESSLKAVLGDNVWDLGDLAPGAEKKVILKGKIYGEENEERVFRFYSGAKDKNDSTEIGIIYNSFLLVVFVEKPFIEGKILVNGEYQNEYTSPSNEEIRVNINWANNLPTKVEDMEIQAKLSGNALNRSRVIASGGFYNSIENEIVWNKDTLSQLASVQPGDNGSLSFSLFSLPSVGSNLEIINDPTIEIEVNLKGRQVEEGGSLKDIISSDRKVIKINSDFQLAVQALHNSGSLENTGPIPPKAEQKTTYSIVWSIKNSANNLKNAEVKATLPIYVNWFGKFLPDTEDITYNGLTREVIWRPGLISRGTGFSLDNREVAFQIELLPSLSQVGSVPLLINETVAVAEDTFTGDILSSRKNSLNTRIYNDVNYNSGDEKVVE